MRARIDSGWLTHWWHNAKCQYQVTSHTLSAAMRGQCYQVCTQLMCVFTRVTPILLLHPLSINKIKLGGGGKLNILRKKEDTMNKDNIIVLSPGHCSTGWGILNTQRHAMEGRKAEGRKLTQFVANTASEWLIFHVQMWSLLKGLAFRMHEKFLLFKECVMMGSWVW